MNEKSLGGKIVDLLDMFPHDPVTCDDCCWSFVRELKDLLQDEGY